VARTKARADHCLDTRVRALGLLVKSHLSDTNRGEEVEEQTVHGWKQKRKRGWEVPPSPPSHAPNDLRPSHKASPPEGSTTSQQHCSVHQAFGTWPWRTFLFFLFFLSVRWGLKSGPVLARQVLYHLIHTLFPFCFSYFSDRILYFVPRLI
jgi:hypothetical protein